MNDLSPVQSQSLPALVDRAATALASARTSAEVLEARAMAGFAYDAAKRTARIAKAKDAHDTLVAAAHRAQADALLIESQAKRRLADEYDAAQERGEVRGANERTVSGSETVGFRDLGLSGKDIHEARQLRDAEIAEPGIVRRVVTEALDRGEEPSKARLREAVIYAARGGGARQQAESRRNPLYVPPSDLTRARTRVSSALTEIEAVGAEFSGAALLPELITEIMRANFLRRARVAIAFLSDILEASDA